MRGFWYIIESVLAAVIVISFLMVISAKYTGSVQPDNPAQNAFLALEALDHRDSLRNYTVAMDYEGLNSQVPIYNYNHTIQICNYGGTCKGVRPNSTTVWTASYLVAGKDEYRPYIVRLYLSPL